MPFEIESKLPSLLKGRSPDRHVRDLDSHNLLDIIIIKYLYLYYSLSFLAVNEHSCPLVKVQYAV